MNGLVIARALHVLAIVVWIGGVAMVTTIVLPALRRGELGPDRLAAFHAIERRFARQARGATLLAGASGLYLLMRLGLWRRLGTASFWWLHAMIGLWLVFSLLLFVAEPAVLHRRFQAWAEADPRAAFAWIQRAHWVLLAAGLLTIAGAVAGSQGAGF